MSDFDRIDRPALEPELREVADLLWERAHGAPPLDQDPVAARLGLAPESREYRLQQTVRNQTAIIEDYQQSIAELGVFEDCVDAVREWCDRTEHAASGDQDEPVFQARMELVDEVRRLLPKEAE